MQVFLRNEPIGSRERRGERTQSAGENVTNEATALGEKNDKQGFTKRPPEFTRRTASVCDRFRGGWFCGL